MGIAVRVFHFARRQLGRLVAASACGALVTAADLVLLVLLRRFVDEGVLSSAPSAAMRLALLALALAAGREMAAYFGGRLSLRTSTALVGELQIAVFDHLHSLSLDFFHRSRPGDLTARLFHDVEAAARLVTEIAVAALEASLRLLGLFAVLWSLHAPMALGVALVLAPSAIVARLLGRSLRGRFQRLYEDLASLHDASQESLGAAEVVKSLGREAEEAAGFATRNRLLVENEAALHDAQALQGPAGQGLQLAALVAALAYGSHEVAAGRLTPGALTAILVAAYGFLGGLHALVGLYTAAQGGLAAAERVFALLDERPSVPGPLAGRAASFGEALRFEDVSFSYPGRGTTLDGVSFVLRPGERVGVIGATGSGKTTLLRLALRLYDPTRGRVTLDGVDLRELDPALLRRLFAVVPQDGWVFDRSLRENVACGRPGAAAEDVEAAVRIAGLEEVAARLPEGLDGRVGARGAALSAGERQRVALARAAVRHAPILLLDEATSAIDGESEQQVQSALAALAHGRTTVTVAHRLSTLRGVDRILVLERGRIVEDGTPAALLERPGRYRRLCEAQGVTPA